jgi:hypothetical protein
VVGWLAGLNRLRWAAITWGVGGPGLMSLVQSDYGGLRGYPRRALRQADEGQGRSPNLFALDIADDDTYSRARLPRATKKTTCTPEKLTCIIRARRGGARERPPLEGPS